MAAPRGTIRERLGRLDWEAIHESLRRDGWARTPALLTAEECARLWSLYSRDRRFRGAMRHGVATVTRGDRFTLGVIFHDAR